MQEDVTRTERTNTQSVPEHLSGLQALAEGYQYYMSYLKNGGEDGVSDLLGVLDFNFD